MSTPAASPRVSIVVPVRNGGRLLERCLRSVLAQDYPRDRLEILVVDNGSTDGSVDTITGLGLSPLRESRPGAAHARNRGVAAATGDIVAFTDADCEVEPSWVGRLVEALGEADAVTGHIEPFPTRGRFARARGALHEMFLRECMRLDRENRLDRLDSANAAVWRRVFDEVGGFNPQIFFVEDRELGFVGAQAPELALVGDRVEPTAALGLRCVVTLERADGAQQLVAELPAQGGCQLRHLAPTGHPVEPGHEQVLQGGRDGLDGEGA